MTPALTPKPPGQYRKEPQEAAGGDGLSGTQDHSLGDLIQSARSKRGAGDPALGLSSGPSPPPAGLGFRPHNTPHPHPRGPRSLLGVLGCPLWAARVLGSGWLAAEFNNSNSESVGFILPAFGQKKKGKRRERREWRERG